MVTAAIPRSVSLETARRAFLDEIGDWVEACIRDYDGLPPTDGHDQATFTTAWEPYIRAAGGRRALCFIQALRDAIRDHFTSNGEWRHGYWRMQEAHHGTEHFEVFLGAFWRLAPGDKETIRQFIDAAEHLGNWVEEVPPWFDWETGLYRSIYFGTDGIRTDDQTDLNVPDHFRCVNVALLAHSMTGELRYLDLAKRHASRWAEAIVGCERLPIALAPEGPLFELGDEEMRAYRAFAGQLSCLADQVDRAENLLASGAVDALLKLWRITGRRLFREAADALMRIVVTQLCDPDAGPAAAIVRTYRKATAETLYDQVVLDASRAGRPFDFTELGIEPEVRRERKPSGIGKRRDMPNWFEDGKPRRHNPILLAAAAEIGGEEELAARAVDIARAYFALARQVYPHGRDHGCSARSVSAIARGHGRDNGAGVVTAVLQIGEPTV